MSEFKALDSGKPFMQKEMYLIVGGIMRKDFKKMLLKEEDQGNGLFVRLKFLLVEM